MNLEEMKSILKEDTVSWRRDLHQIPETGVDLPETAGYVKNVLDSLGVSYQDNVGLESAIVATVIGTGEGNGKVVALRGDMDALPVKEETGLEFASKNDKMHACGHDGHTSALLGAVKVLNQVKDQFGGTVKFLFQPGEEISAGAEPMVKAGALKNPDVDYIIGMHQGNLAGPHVPAGVFSFHKGSLLACLDRFTLTVKGISAHGAYPHESVDPIVIASYIVTALQEIMGREIKPTEPGVVTVGKFHGGSTYNVIPASVEIEGTARAVNQETREQLARRIGEIAEGVAKAFRGEVDFQYFYGAPPLVNDAEVTERVYESTRALFGDDRVEYLDKPSMGGEDFAVYLQEVPGTFIFYSNPLPIDGTIWAHHNSRFALDDSYIADSAAAMVNATLDLLKK